MTTPRLLSETDAAAYLGVSATKLRGAGLPRKVWGGRKLYDRHDLDAFVESLAYDVAENTADDIQWGASA
ncbi:MAG: DNA-binding protein [Pseudomonadota bacterium]